jgi:small conductance mechanosensitive channel
MNYLQTALSHSLPNPELRLLVAFLIGIGLALVINKLMKPVLRLLLRYIGRKTDTATTDTRFEQMRRVETFVSIGMAVGRTVIFAAALGLAWSIANPASAPFAVIGASTVFVVLAGATVAPLLRDITYGSVMTAERWFNVGDHVAVDPFWELSGVVEQITLRSTRLRSLTGEVIWVHNQHIQAVRVTPRAVRTIALDVFVNDLERGKLIISAALQTLPSGPTMVTRKMTISESEKVGDKLWRITAVGQTALGREWLIQDFAVGAVMKEDEMDGTDRTIVHGPIVRFMDATAEKRFRRSAQSVARK